MSAEEKNPPAVVELHGVTVNSSSEHGKAVLRNVDWTVRAGEFWLVAGLHGAGKSHLMSLLACLNQPGSGSYRLFSQEMPGDEEEGLPARLKMGAVFEHAGMLHHLSVRENIALPLLYHSSVSDGEVERRTEWALEFTGLAPQAGSLPRRLSRPWRKRAGLARALCAEPELLLLDLPLNGLDPRDSAWWLKTLGQLNRGEVFKGKPPVTLVVSADDLRPWRRMGCHLAMLKDGRFHDLGREQDWSGGKEPLIAELLAEHVPSADEENIELKD